MVAYQATGASWDRRSLLLPSPSTPSTRFSRDVSAGFKAQVWVEAVIGQRLPDGGFAAALKDGRGLCQLINTFRPGTIPKVDTSSSPFKQMSNISAFIKACRALGVREHALFETLDLFNEKRLPQVARCLFSLSEVVRTTMPDFQGPYLSSPDKPEVDPAVKAVVDIAKGHAPAPGWGGGGAHTPNCATDQPGGCVAGGGDGSGGGGSIAHTSKSNSLHLVIPRQGERTGSGCLSPAANASGRLTYGVFEGGGEAKPLLRPTVSGSSGGGSGKGGGAVVKAGTVEAVAAQREVDDGCGGPKARAGAGAGAEGGTVEMSGSTRPMASTPRLMHAPETSQSLSPRSLASQRSRTSSGIASRGARRVLTREEEMRRRREALARTDAELEAAFWIERVTGVTFPGKFWSSLKDGVLLCKLVNAIRPGLVPRVNTSRAPFPEMENITAFLAACRTLGVAEASLFDTKDLHQKRDLAVVVRCIYVLGTAVQYSVPDFKGPFLGKKSESFSRVNARGLRKQLGKGPGARGGIHVLGGLKATCERGLYPADAVVEQVDPTVTLTPAESPSGKKTPRPRGASDSAAGSEGGRSQLQRGGDGAAPPTAPQEKAAKAEEHWSRAQVTGPTGGRNLVADFTSESSPAARVVGETVQRSVQDGGDGVQRRRPREDDDDGESVELQVQAFVELHTTMPWRVSGNLYESLRDGWQLALLANALRPGAVRRVHNSIQPAKHVQNIANFLISCRRMGVARALLFDVDDLYANRSQTKVVRTLLALRALATDPDFASARRSSLIGSSLLISAASVQGAAAPKSESQSSAAAAGLWG